MTSGSLEGQMLGKYRVLESLGRGGMARVYRAYHPRLDRYVAIKVMRPDLAEDDEFLARFQREARAVAALRHANIVRVHDFDVEGDIYYMVMELLAGDTLKTRLNDYRVRGEQIPWGEMVRIVLDVLDGLAYAHSERIIHRDIKPANILLTRRGEAVVGDFGITHIVGGTRHTASGALIGTLEYMAPEQGLEGRCDARSDLYSLGIVFYEMLTQRTPFDADTPLAVLMKHIHDPLPLPRKSNPEIPEPLERVVLKALAKRPEDRYQGAEQMAKALRAAAEEADIPLPTRISQPLSFTTAESPSESVAVISGTTRQVIADARFADDETDVTLGHRLAAERVAQAGSGPTEVAGPPEEGGEADSELVQAGQELLSAMGAVAQVALSRTTDALRRVAETAEEKAAAAKQGRVTKQTAAEEGSAAEKTSAAGETSPAEETSVEKETPATGEAAATEEAPRRDILTAPHLSVGQALLAMVGIIGIANLLMLTFATVTGRWHVYEIGWPTELFLASLALSVVMYATSSIWFLLPIITVFGTGLLMAYSSLTGHWTHWNFLWLFQVWFVAMAVAIPLYLSREGIARSLSRQLAWLAGAFSVVMAAVTLVVAALGGRLILLLAGLALLIGFLRRRRRRRREFF
jgi:serine/threonine protein kinase